MKRQAFQPGEIRDEQDNIIRPGAYGKNTALATSDNMGILDYIINNFQALFDMISGACVYVDELPTSGDTDKLYVVKSTGKTYRWGGKQFILVSEAVDGLSAYEIAKQNGFTGTEEEWLESIRGEKGDSITGATVDSDGYLILTLGTGTTIKTALKPLVDAKQYADNAAASATQAGESETNAASSASTATAQANTATTQANNAKTSATNSANSASASAKSASNAKTSETNASSSATTAKNWAVSETSPDGATDTDSTTGKTQSSRTWALESKASAESSSSSASIATNQASSARASASDASKAATAASGSATNAASSATSASDSASSAASSAASASDSASSAASSAASASDSKDKASEYKTSASSSATAAASSASSANTSATNAKAAMNTANTAASSARASASDASKAATAASGSATNAASSATSASDSASSAASSAASASDSASSAASSAASASDSKDKASEYKTSASSSATAAASSASSANTSATNAKAAMNTANTAASSASTSATSASTSASNASKSEVAAKAAQAEAEKARDDANSAVVKLTGVMKYAGQVDNYSDLADVTKNKGDVWNIVNADASHGVKAGDNVAWNGTDWDNLSGYVDLSAFAQKGDYQKTITSATANGATITFNHKDGTTSTTTVNNVASSISATYDAKGQKIDATYEKIADASNVHTSLQNSINTKQDKLTFDTTPTATSHNPVTSDGIKTALDTKLDKTGTAAAATKATQDGAGNNIVDTYAKKYDVAALLSTKLNVTATAYAATRDGAGNNIVDTYAKKSEIPSVPVKGVKISGSTSNLTPDTSGIVTIPAIPTKVSAFTNDAGYLTTHQDLSGYQTKLTFDSTPTANSSNPVTSAGIKAAIDAKTVDLSNYYTKTQVDSAISTAISAIVDGDSKSY